jgi:hypothetical protein
VLVDVLDEVFQSRLMSSRPTKAAGSSSGGTSITFRGTNREALTANRERAKKMAALALESAGAAVMSCYPLRRRDETQFVRT